MPDKPQDDQLNETEIAARRDDAVRRALSTPPKPHKPLQAGNTTRKAPKLVSPKRTTGKGRARVGKAR